MPFTDDAYVLGVTARAAAKTGLSECNCAPVELVPRYPEPACDFCEAVQDESDPQDQSDLEYDAYVLGATARATAKTGLSECNCAPVELVPGYPEPACDFCEAVQDEL